MVILFSRPEPFSDMMGNISLRTLHFSLKSVKELGKKRNCTCSELIRSNKQICTVKYRKFDVGLSKYLFIRNKFETQWIQKIGPIHDLF